MRKRQTQALSDVIKEVLKKQKLNKGLLENRAVHYWEKVLGPSVASATHRIYIRNGVLFVEMTSSVLRNELMMWKDKIIHNLNQAIGENIVRDIVFR
jgi:predicted nucleic acid-binding Zn ribbon protein